ncbi:hypothetical protein Btru_050995 [Bulinus truncatus]|nr:hypothetical protein Btru_050995 [Bulinus truncatus]
MGVLKIFWILMTLAHLCLAYAEDEIIVGDMVFPMYTCRGQADIVFVVDASTSITRAEFMKMLAVSATVASVMRLGPGDSRVGLVVFGDDAKVSFGLNAFFDSTSMRKAIFNNTYLGGSTQTDKGLMAAYEILRQSQNSRPDASGLVVLMTDGRSTDPAKTRSVADLLHQINVKVITVGFGQDVHDSELLDITKDCSNVFKAATFDSLHHTLAHLVLKTCKAINGVQVPDQDSSNSQCKSKADITLLIDSSSTIGEFKFREMLHFAANLTSQFTIGLKDVLFAAVLMGERVNTIFDLYDLTSSDLVIEALLSLPYMDETSNIVRALSFANEMKSPAAGARVKAQKLIVLITDGLSGNVDDAVDVSLSLRQRDFDIITVGVGEADEAKLVKIAGSQEKFFKLENTETSQVANKIYGTMCRYS